MRVTSGRLAEWVSGNGSASRQILIVHSAITKDRLVRSDVRKADAPVTRYLLQCCLPVPSLPKGLALIAPLADEVEAAFEERIVVGRWCSGEREEGGFNERD